MALLLAMYQKLRLIRERNQLTLELSQGSSKLTRIEKNIERTQKYYTSLFQQLDSQAKMLQNNATSWLQQQAGLGVNSFDPFNYGTAFSGINGFVMQNMAQLLTTGKGMPYSIKNDDGTYSTDYTGALSQSRYDELWAIYNRNNGRFNPVYQKDEDGNNTTTINKVHCDIYGKDVYEYEDGIQQWEVDAFNWAMQQARQNQQQAQFNVQQASSNFANGVSIWVEAQKAQLECQQDAALEPLTYEQTMLELDKELKEHRLKRIEGEIESYTQLADKGAEDMAPKFGLG